MMTNTLLFIIIAAFGVQGFALATAMLYYWRKARAMEKAALSFAKAIYEEKMQNGLTAEQARDEMLVELCGAEPTTNGE